MRLSRLPAAFILSMLAGVACPVTPLVSAQSVGEAPPGFYGKSWALIIGINAYQKVTPRLNYAVPDAQAVAAALLPLGFPRENIRVLLDGEATKAKIETVLYREFARIGPEDRLLVYFAGHGDTVPVRGGEEGYFLPVDADPDALPLTAIAMEDVRRIGKRVRAKHVLFVMDACFSGFALTRDVTPTRITDAYLSSALREPVVQVLTAGRKGERAIEDGGHGLFTRRVLDGLRGLADPDGRGIITAGQLAAWLEPRVVRDSDGRMHPQYSKLDGEGQFVFLRPGARIGALPERPTSEDDRRLSAIPKAPEPSVPSLPETLNLLREALAYSRNVPDVGIRESLVPKRSDSCELEFETNIAFSSNTYFTRHHFSISLADMDPSSVVARPPSDDSQFSRWFVYVEATAGEKIRVRTTQFQNDGTRRRFDPSFVDVLKRSRMQVGPDEASGTMSSTSVDFRKDETNAKRAADALKRAITLCGGKARF